MSRNKRETLYFDPPYGIKFNSNWQVSTRSRDVSDGKLDHITREPEQVKAFRDTWKDGIHSYLTYLRDRLTAMRDLLTESGSIFVQIGDENVHRVRALMDEVFGEENFIGLIWFRKKTMPLGDKFLERMGDYIVWYGKNEKETKFRRLFKPIDIVGDFHWNWRQFEEGTRKKFGKRELEANPPGDPLRLVSMWPPSFSEKDVYPVSFQNRLWNPPEGQCWPTTKERLERVTKANRIEIEGAHLRYVMRLSDDDTTKLNLTWIDTIGARDQRYVVETNPNVVQRCILMTSDPGDLVLDPTCGSGTTATVAEQWGRRWITVDTSRVSLALARARLMGARYPYYLLADSPEGRRKEAALSGRPPSDTPMHGDIRQGFVYERAPHITLKSIANNAEIDEIWEKWQATLEPLRARLNEAAGTSWEEWEIPRDLPGEDAKKVAAFSSSPSMGEDRGGGDGVPAPYASDRASGSAPPPRPSPIKGEGAPTTAGDLHRQWWDARIARQREIDASIARKADVELLYDRPYEDTSRVRVAGPFTVESLSPHRVVPADEVELIEELDAAEGKRARVRAPLDDFAGMVLENLRSAGVHQAARDDRIAFTALEGWPGGYIAAEGHFMEGETARRAAIFIGPEFGTVSRADLVAAAREALDARFDALIACGFNFDAHTSELTKLGPLPILKAKMNPDLHMSDELKNTGAGNLFVVFGEPDIDWTFNDEGEIVVEVLGIDVFDPKTGEVRASGKDDIAAWFIDTDYNEESFFVRHAYFLGSNDPYKSLKTSLKAEIDREAWETLYRDTSRPFPRPTTGRFAVKVINHFGDEVMKVFGV